LEKRIKKETIVSVILLGGGSSIRMQGIDKLCADLGGKTVLARSLQAFQDCKKVTNVILVANIENEKRYEEIIRQGSFSKVVGTCIGGIRRQDSVAAGLSKLKCCNSVVVHDADRPFVTPEMIESCIDASEETGAAIVAVPAIDTIKMVGESSIVEKTFPRDKLWLVQTPQVFRFEMLKEAHAKIKDYATDDSFMVEQLGNKVKIVMGSYKNIKITNPSDLVVANLLWSS
jgi:2-C-methyl-D-erythritol 4-phosphate cytidylyltransferase